MDAYRALAMFVVVAWHWVFTIAIWTDEGPRVDNPISFRPGLGYLTWVLQVMPLFFLVGGHLTRRAVEGMDGPAVRRWSGRRLRRLVAPAVPLVASLAAVHVAARAYGADALADAAVLVATPLWFLVVYVAIVALAPVVHPIARRWPIGHVAVLVALCALWDVARFAGLIDGAWLWTSMITLWLTVHQMGGALDRVSRRTARRAIGGGPALLAVATSIGPYPVSMVGNTGDELSNMGPPTAVLLALALVQLGIVVLTRDRVARLAAAHPVLLDRASRYAMPVYLWHMVGFGVCVVVAAAAGFTLPTEPTLGWWLARPLWVVGPALVAWPLIRRSAPRDGAARLRR